MKLLLILLMVPAIVAAQTIPPKANVIIVKGVSFMEVCNSLLDHGYAIKTKDNELQTAITEPQKYPKYWNAGYVINIRVKDSAAYISGTFTAPFSSYAIVGGAGRGSLWNGDPVYHHTNRKGVTHPKSLIGYPFTLMNEFALSFGKPVEYRVQ